MNLRLRPTYLKKKQSGTSCLKVVQRKKCNSCSWSLHQVVITVISHRRRWLCCPDEAVDGWFFLISPTATTHSLSMLVWVKRHADGGGTLNIKCPVSTHVKPWPSEPRAKPLHSEATLLRPSQTASHGGGYMLLWLSAVIVNVIKLSIWTFNVQRARKALHSLQDWTRPQHTVKLTPSSLKPLCPWVKHGRCGGKSAKCYHPESFSVDQLYSGIERALESNRELSSCLCQLSFL